MEASCRQALRKSRYGGVRGCGMPERAQAKQPAAELSDPDCDGGGVGIDVNLPPNRWLRSRGKISGGEEMRWKCVLIG